jgi:hypothetical protein
MNDPDALAFSANTIESGGIKFVPLITTVVPTGPEEGEKPLIVGVCAKAEIAAKRAATIINVRKKMCMFMVLPRESFSLLIRSPKLKDMFF